MKTLKKTLSLILVFASLMMCLGASFSAGAAGIMPMLDNTYDVRGVFNISASKKASVSVNYFGYSNVTTGAHIEIQLQKKVLLWWSDVDGGNWYDYCTGVSGSVSHSLYLSSSGKYRAVVTVTVHGSYGDDVLENTYTAEC